MPARRLAGLAVTAGVLTAVSLVLPWVRVSGRDRSSIELIGSAGALDVIEGGVRVAVVATWFLVPVLVAFALLAGAAGRLGPCAWLLVPLGPALAGLIALAALAAGDLLIWGAYLTAAGAVLTTTLAFLVLRTLRAGSDSRQV